MSEPPGKTMNTGVGSLFLLQEIFPTQESNQDLLHCRQILHQLSYQGSPLGKSMQETAVQSLVQEDPTCLEATNRHTTLIEPVL